MLHCVTPRYVAGDGDLVWVRAQLESGELGLHTRHPGGSQQHATIDQGERERAQTSHTTVRMQLLRVQHCMGSPIIDIVIQALLQVRLRVGRIRLPPPAQCGAAQHSALIRASQV